MFTVSETEKYIQRIGYTGGITPSFKNLDALMKCHMKTIPYETVGLHRTGQTPSLDIDDLFQKVVVDRRGGYCFELNKLFRELLRTLGYRSRSCFARSTDTPGVLDPVNHCGNLVELDGNLYSADVGWGGPAPGGPLLIEDCGFQDIDGKQFIVERTEKELWWRVDRISSPESGSKRCGMMELCTLEVQDIDFQALNLYCSMPGMEFRDRELANISRDDGYISLTDNKLTVADASGKRVREIAPKERDSVLSRYFGL